MRISKENYYLNIAEAVLQRATCLRRCFGAVLVKNDEILSTGYNGSPREDANCCDTGICERQRLGCKPGERYELCVSVHAEQNALLSVSRQEAIGSTLYLVGKDAVSGELITGAQPCKVCERFIKNMGVEKVVVRDTPTKYRVLYRDDLNGDY